MIVSSARLLTSLLLAGALLTQVHASEPTPNVQELVLQARYVTSETQVREFMTKLVVIDNKESATAFTDIFLEKVLPRRMRMMPFLAIMYEFQNTPGTSKALLTLLRQLDAENLANHDRVYVSGLLARFGDTRRVGFLTDEYRRSPSWGYSVLILETLSRTNDVDASNFVLNVALDSTDPTIKLTIERVMRETGNASSIDLMRNWMSNEPGDFDLVVAQQYLRSIIEFGDCGDREFLEWLESNADDNFPPADFEKLIAPLLDEANDHIRTRSPENSCQFN